MSWKCDYCDSYNEDTSTKCFVCGQARSKKKVGASVSSEKTEKTTVKDTTKAKTTVKDTTKAKKEDYIKGSTKKSSSAGGSSTKSSSAGSSSRKSSAAGSSSTKSSAAGSSSKRSPSGAGVFWAIVIIAIVLYLILYSNDYELFGRADELTRMMGMLMESGNLNADPVLIGNIIQSLV